MAAQTGSIAPSLKTSAEYQRKLARYCLTDEFEPLPGAREDRLKVYRRLVWGVVEDTLSGAYPIAEFLLGPKKWDKFIRAFFREYPSSSPELWLMPKGLYDFAVTTGYGRRRKLPFLEHLLLFEWKEIELHMAEDPVLPPFERREEFGLDEVPVLNPVSEILQLAFPVYRAKSIEEISAEGSYFLLMFRHPELLDVKFIEISPFFAAVLGILSAGGVTPRQALDELAALSNISVTDGHVEQTKLFVAALVEQQVILGS